MIVHTSAPGAWVVYDSYWDPVEAYERQADAEAACLAGGSHPGCHVLWSRDASPGDLRALSGRNFEDFLAEYPDWS
jgi:hypothetical protein